MIWPLVFFIALLAFFLHLMWPHISGRGAGYGRSDLRAAERALELVDVRGKTFYELGCGYGDVLAMAARAGARAKGVELDPIRWLICRARCRGCEVVLGDMFKVPLNDADVVYIFQWPSVNEKLAEKFEKELKPGALVISYYWEVPGMELVLYDERHKLYIYRKK
ncbi:MAG: methyltransferase domain-containing protein [Thermoproteus sp. AZ2]|jgi:SAM-dependent methyltransferase|uniref:Methyltransferase domain-containing protein n=1 Tax=Thermoproteus sp. AZ2 TaxID=1609232 RepID=A0ACC6V1D6_9CREN|nr:MAG: RNA methyltransferase [Thermoproteus sp. AZ2]